MTINLQEIQKEHGVWATYNFGPRNPVLCLLGVTEEIGELCEAELYIQSYENSVLHRNKFDIDAMDAIGDIMIYFIDYCNGVNFDVQAIYHTALSRVDPSIDSKVNPLITLISVSRYLGKLCHAELKKVQSIRGYNNPEKFKNAASAAIQDVLFHLLRYCEHHRFDLEEALRATWDSVKQRDFQKFPLNGKDQ